MRVCVRTAESNTPECEARRESATAAAGVLLLLTCSVFPSTRRSGAGVLGEKLVDKIGKGSYGGEEIGTVAIGVGVGVGVGEGGRRCGTKP